MEVSKNRVRYMSTLRGSGYCKLVQCLVKVISGFKRETMVVATCVRLLLAPVRGDTI